VLPDGMAGTEAIARFLVEEISRDTYVNIMDQYRPMGRIRPGDPLARRITREEFSRAREAARRAGLWRFDEERFHLFP